ncbi:MAG: CBS domain-containing protein [Proteobacteria bacterium]|nr:CBS domain-containing protein [Pseudomonadota bacterium]
MSTMPKVSDYMDTIVHTLNPETEIHKAADFLLENRVTGAPVVDNNGKLVGIFNEYDCLKLLALGGDLADRPEGTVADFMSKDVKTVPSRMNIFFVAGMFLNDHIRRFPVVDDGKLVGAITRFDILRAIHKAHEEGIV